MKSIDEVLAELRELSRTLEAQAASSLFANENVRIGLVREMQTIEDAAENLESVWSDRNAWKSTGAVLMGQKTRAWGVMKNAPHEDFCLSEDTCVCWKADMKAALQWKGNDRD